MKKITIYTGPLCNYCDAAKRLLTRNNATYNEINIATVDGAMDEMIKKANGKRTIPQIFYDEQHIGGYDEVRALEKENKEINVIKNKKIKKSTKKRNIDLLSYKIIFILKDVDPKDPTAELSSILSNSEVNFEIEKIERILDSKNKSMNKN